jgi:hypothetical protein
MTELMPLRKVVVDLTHEAVRDDTDSIRKAIKAWHNRLSNGSVPKKLVMKLGRSLYLDLDAWENWLKERKENVFYQGPGRPRSE